MSYRRQRQNFAPRTPKNIRRYREGGDLTQASIHGFRLWDSRVWAVIFAEAEKALMENPDLFSDIDL